MTARDDNLTDILGTDAELAAAVREAAERFEATIDAAYNAGISVRFGIASTWGGKPSICKVHELRIQRDGDWVKDTKDIIL